MRWWFGIAGENDDEASMVEQRTRLGFHQVCGTLNAWFLAGNRYLGWAQGGNDVDHCNEARDIESRGVD